MIVTLFGHWDALDILLTTFSKVRNRHWDRNCQGHWRMLVREQVKQGWQTEKLRQWCSCDRSRSGLHRGARAGMALQNCPYLTQRHKTLSLTSTSLWVWAVPEERWAMSKRFSYVGAILGKGLSGRPSAVNTAGILRK
jgi:hypothetical protein